MDKQSPEHEQIPQPARPASFAVDEPAPVIPGQAGEGPRSIWRDGVSVIAVLGGALMLAFVLISFVFQSYQVDGPSMQTTLENKDHLVVWKVPKTTAKLTGRKYIPNRGDVIIFNLPHSGPAGEDEQLIKRVIALPGERVTVQNDVVTVYNHEHPAGFSPDKQMPYGKVITFTPGNVDETLGKNEIYVMGDHRDNSKDSRFFGPIVSDQIVGKLAVRVLPLNTFQIF